MRIAPAMFLAVMVAIIVAVPVSVIFVLPVVVAVIVPVVAAHVCAVKALFPAAMMVPVRAFITPRQISLVAIAWIKVVVHITVEPFGPVEPRSGANEHTAAEPCR